MMKRQFSAEDIKRREEFMKKRIEMQKEMEIQKLASWNPISELGKKVKTKSITSIEEVLKSNQKILEEEITETLLPELEIAFINIGQSKGKFGGGRRKIQKQTQKITKEGSIMSFSMCAISGNKDGVLGLGFGKARETVPAREKTTRKVKLNLISVRRGAGNWDSFGAGLHTIPFAVKGKCGSCEITLMPAPKGTGLVAEGELKRMFKLAGIKDIWTKTQGNTKNKTNLMKAGFEALKNLQKVRLTNLTKKGRSLEEEGNEKWIK